MSRLKLLYLAYLRIFALALVLVALSHTAMAADDFTLPDLSGNQHSLSDYRGNGCCELLATARRAWRNCPSWRSFTTVPRARPWYWV